MTTIRAFALSTSSVLTTGLICASLALSAPSFADDRPAHSTGEPSHTLAEAMANLTEYNNRLEELLGKKELSAQDMHDIHMLTYTLENALETIEDSVDKLEDSLEKVHVASEHGDTNVVKTQGRAYLDGARELTK
jgi:hypothetical protein